MLILSENVFFFNQFVRRFIRHILFATEPSREIQLHEACRTCNAVGSPYAPLDETAH